MSQMQPPASQMYQGTGGQQAGRQAGMGQFGGMQGGPGGMQGAGIQRARQPASSRFFPTQSYLSEQVRTETVAMLNQALADTVDLLTQVKAAHWNVKGPNFYALHLLFDEIAEDLEHHADEIAERATALGGEAKATARIAAAASRIPELPPDPVVGREFVQVVADRLSIHDANLGEDIRFATRQDDVDTADLLNEISREVTKDLWFLEAHLQTQPVGASGGGQAGQGQFGRGPQTQGLQPTGQGQQYGQGRPGEQQFGGQPMGRSQEFGGPSAGRQYGKGQQPTQWSTGLQGW